MLHQIHLSLPQPCWARGETHPSSSKRCVHPMETPPALHIGGHQNQRRVWKRRSEEGRELPCVGGHCWRHLPAAGGWQEQVVEVKADTSQCLIVPVSSFMTGSQKVP